MPDRATTLALTLTAVGTTAAMVDRVLPPIHEVRQTPPDPETTAHIRREWLRTSVVVGALAAGVSAATRSLTPLLAVSATSAWLWWEYERAAGHDPRPGGRSLP